MRVQAFDHVIALGGTCADTLALRDHLTGSQHYWAADRGAQRLLDLGIWPEWVCGDFDSIHPETLKALRAAQIPLTKLARDKDETDSQHLVHSIDLREGQQVLMIGAFSQIRPDHQAANLVLGRSLLRRGLSVCLTDGHTFLHLLQGPQSFCYNWEDEPRLKPPIVSLVCPEGFVEGVESTGLAYPTAGWHFGSSTQTGICNLPSPDAHAFTLQWQAGFLDVYLIYPADAEETSIVPSPSYWVRRSQ